MKHAIVISPRVVERLRFMDADERRLIFDTLVHDEILCDTRTAELTPSQALNYLMVRDMIMRDSMRLVKSLPIDSMSQSNAAAYS